MNFKDSIPKPYACILVTRDQYNQRLLKSLLSQYHENQLYPEIYSISLLIFDFLS